MARLLSPWLRADGYLLPPRASLLFTLRLLRTWSRFLHLFFRKRKALSALLVLGLGLITFLLIRPLLLSSLLPYLGLTLWLTLDPLPLGLSSLLIDLGLASSLAIFHPLRGSSGLSHLRFTLLLLLHRHGLSSLLSALGLNTLLAVKIPRLILLPIALLWAAVWLIFSCLRQHPFGRFYPRLGLGIRLTFHLCVPSSLSLTARLIKILAINLDGLTFLPISLRLTVLRLIRSPLRNSSCRLHL